jgi:hypothetical protein
MPVTPANIQPQFAGNGGTNLVTIEVFPFNRRGLHDITGQGIEAGFLTQSKTQHLHPTQQTPLLVAYLRQYVA